uniref:Uncharacterized protein n=1 Tax=Acrobeloides nanus TaxID=290746 RepID=A0A914C8T3_9BILA
MLSLLWNYPTVSIFSNTAALDSKHDDPSSSHERIDMDHNILEYFLKLNPHFVKEVHVWKSAVSVLRGIRTSGIKKIRWFHNDNFLYDDIMEEFMRIFRDNADALKNLEVDYALLNFVPFFILKLDSLSIPNFGGTLDEIFIKEANTQALILKEAAELCRSRDCLACNNKCEFSMNWDIKHFTVEFSRALSEEFRTLLNINKKLLLKETCTHWLP